MFSENRVIPQHLVIFYSLYPLFDKQKILYYNNIILLFAMNKIFERNKENEKFACYQRT